MFFFFILIIIVLNLIFGVIIDTFGALREEKAEADEILRNSCFVCALKRMDFENQKSNEKSKTLDVVAGGKETVSGAVASDSKSGILHGLNAPIGFENHIKYEHNMWHYSQRLFWWEKFQF